MPVYRNDGEDARHVEGTNGQVVSVGPGELVTTYELLTASGWVMVSSNPPFRPRPGQAITLFAGGQVAAGASAVSPPMEVWQLDGLFGLQASLAEAGTARLEAETSNDNSQWSEPEGADDVFSGKTAADGVMTLQVAPDFARYLRFRVTETGGVSALAPTITVVAR